MVCVFLFLTYFTWYGNLQTHPCCCRWHYFILFSGQVVAQLVKNLPAMQETLVQFLVGKTLWRRDRLPTPVFLGFPGGSDECACNAGDLGLIPGLGTSPGGGHGNALQYSCLENPHGQRSWWATVHGVAKS